MNVNKNQKIVMMLFSVGLLCLVVGFSYAFFMYGKTGLYTHTINGGKMNVIYDETTGNNITIDNAYPLTDEEALTKSLEFEFTITGYNESEKNVYYAIEIAHGEDVEGKNRFKDSDMKLTLYENEELVIENEIFNNLDNQGIYYGYINYGTSIDTPITNNYKLRLWINDNTYINNTLENDITLWDDMDYRWIEEHLNYEDLYKIYYNEVTTLEELGKSVYTSEIFANSYANFKVNVIANLTGNDIGILVYNANGGTSNFSTSSLSTNRITAQKPVKENMAFVGWSSDKNATEPEYYAGDYYSGNAQTLYAVYNETKNVMDVFAESILEYGESVSEIYFINDKFSNLQSRYDASSIKADITLNNQGKVLSWLEVGEYGYILYVGSEGTTYLSNCVNLFSPFVNCYYINLMNIDTIDVTDMSGMFSSAGRVANPEYSSNENNDYVVKSLSYAYSTDSNYLMIENMESLNTTNVTNFSDMFYLTGVLEIDVTQFDTSKAINMKRMFSSCRAVYEIDLGNFNTSNVTDMSQMFYDSWGFVSLNLTGWDVSKVTDMSAMFAYTFSLEKLVLGNDFNTSSVANMANMFNNSNLRNLDLSSLNTSNVIDMSGMFKVCQFEYLNLSGIDTSQVTNMSQMFDEIYSEKIGPGNQYNININNLDTSSVINMSQMFNNCRNLVTLNLNNFNTSQVTDMSYMFYNCMNLENLEIENFITTQVTNMSHMFAYCEKLENLNLESFDTKLVTDMSYMFNNCESLGNLNLESFDTSSVLNMASMFSFCDSLINLDVNHFNTSKVTNILDIFAGCKSLLILDLSNWDISSVTQINNTNWDGLFRYCSSLIELDISSFDFSRFTFYTYVFNGMPDNATIYVMNEITQNCILGIDSSKRPAWTTSNVIVKTA